MTLLTDHSPLLAALVRHAERRADRVALIDREERITYRDLWLRVRNVAGYLTENGVTPGDRIALSATKDSTFVYLYYAVHLAGGVAVIIDPTANAERKAFILRSTEPRLVFGLKGVEGNIDLKDVPLDRPAYDREDSFTSTLPAEILFTTGTTGLPKGVVLTHAHIAASAERISRFIGNDDSDVEVLGLPVCHSFGLGRLRSCLLKGGAVVLLGSFANLKAFFSAIERYGVTGFGMVPAVWEYIKKLSGERIGAYADRLRYIEIGSAALPTADKQLLVRLFPSTRICMHYGLTEASRSLFMEMHAEADDLNTAGRPVSRDVSVKVMDENGREVDDGCIGELCISGPTVMNAYLKPKDNDGTRFGSYFRTGDLGYRAPDGRFYLVSRVKEMINVGGKKVSPQEVEESIIATGGVADCVCAAMPDPRGVLGEVVCAYLLRTGATLEAEEIARRLDATLEAYKRPAAYEWIDRIPATASGKKQRLALRKE